MTTHAGGAAMNAADDAPSAGDQLRATLVAALVDLCDRCTHSDEAGCGRCDDCDEEQVNEEGTPTCDEHGPAGCPPCECGLERLRTLVRRALELSEAVP